MKSIASISSVRAMCQYSAYALVLSRGLMESHTHLLARLFAGQIPCKRLAPPCISTLRRYHTTSERGAMAHQLCNLPSTEEKDHELMLHLERCLSCTGNTATGAVVTQTVSPISPNKTQAIRDSLTMKALFEGEVLPELCTRLTEAPSNQERIKHLAILLGVCVEFGVDPYSPVVSRLKEECRAQLSRTDIKLPHLCHLGEVAYRLEGRRSEIVVQVLDSVSASMDKALSPDDAAQVYSLLALCQDTHQWMLGLHRQTERLIHRLTASNISDILYSLGALQQSQAISLILKLSRRASRLFQDFTGQELLRVLASLMHFGHHDQGFLAAMEKHLPGRIAEGDVELISTAMEFCLQMSWRSEPIFEAVAEGFVSNAEKYSTPQIACQIVAMGRLNYLPECSSQMFSKLESILQSRFSQFQPRAVIEVLHSCIHLERFPINFVSKVFSPYFLQRLQAQGEPLDKNSLGQLTQLNLSTSLECTHYRGRRLPYDYHIKKFSSVDHSFETPMDRYLYSQVKGPLSTLLGGKDHYTTRVFTQTGYTIDLEINLDEDGFVLPLSQWEHTQRRMALCLDGKDRFCSNTQHLLGKEATKRRHLRRLGYQVVQIPYYEFEKQRRPEDQVRYLHKKIFPTIFKFSR
ncbi:FAST kinase domain-containing protein 3, mitochondrial-like [Osmerus eperlanus]|uniref:FAST kinase domain-containing protein 3, mitochondrial-like n=1 Tax=Osmerus eperlanus TaxID=29151 RepID=UPI002E15C090